MAKLELKIDTAEALAKIEELNAEVQKYKAAMAGLKQAADDTTKSMNDFFDVCANIEVNFKQ